MSKTRPKAQTVQRLTYFVVQTYQEAARGGLSLDPPIEARDRQHALRLFERYKAIRAGVVAFSRTGDPVAGDWDNAVIHARHGRVSAEIDLMEPFEEIEGLQVA
jgi:hypothetical protein